MPTLPVARAAWWRATHRPCGTRAARRAALLHCFGGDLGERIADLAERRVLTVHHGLLYAMGLGFQPRVHLYAHVFEVALRVDGYGTVHVRFDPHGRCEGVLLHLDGTPLLLPNGVTHLRLGSLDVPLGCTAWEGAAWPAVVRDLWVHAPIDAVIGQARMAALALRPV